MFPGFMFFSSYVLANAFYKILFFQFININLERMLQCPQNTGTTASGQSCSFCSLFKFEDRLYLVNYDGKIEKYILSK